VKRFAASVAIVLGAVVLVQMLPDIQRYWRIKTM
jgi:hypothetical protein